MLAFITSLRHPQNSADYARVERLLKVTLDSVCAQTIGEFVVIVVGNQRPAFALPESVHFVAVDFPPPSEHSGPRTPMKAFVWDKGTKIGIGLVAARTFSPDYVMIFDADDFVHRDLARFVSENSGPAGWVVEHGYMFSRSRNVYRRQSAFNRVCGTCHVVAYDTYATPPDMTVQATQQEVELAFGERMRRIMGAHKDGVEWFSENGTALQPLPFPGAVYHVDTGENHSGKQMSGVARPLRPQMSATFGIPLQVSSLRDAWSAFGPRALGQSIVSFSARVMSKVRRAAGSKH